jgi:dipeptidyl aminopeptidase/acylaminoacyl peptidase
MTERLTAGDESTNFIEISPDSKMILYSKVFYGQPKRPYYRTDYYILNLESMQADSILSLYFSSGISWSPDSKQLLILGGSTTFDEIGNTLPENIIPNDYDTQAYIYDITSKEAKSITKNFDPQINDAKWDGKHNVIYFTTTDESYKHLYRYDITSGHYELIELGSEVLHSIDYSNDFSTAIFKASSSNIPEKVYKIDLLTGKVETFLFPEEKQYRHIKLGEVKDWVYTLQPSGATGFGTEFSAKHVNDWGTLTAQEIIEGTEKFVSAHKYVDPNKLGCLGASYGGFETMSLITKTDMFSAAISHAGISNLTSYWGVGYWGYSYNAVAAAESFPWNRRDVYVDKSPLFSADKINTPLLLLHGNTDPNVPPGESMQMYVALKLLNKDVTLIEIDKQQHWILDYDKRTKWTKTIIAYFDKYLKGQPEWWNSLYN